MFGIAWLRHAMRWLAVVALCALSAGPVLTASAGAAAPPDFQARYELSRAGFTVGRSDLRFSRPFPKRYDYALHTRATGMARMVLKSEVLESSRGRITADGFRPDVYRYVRRGDERARRAELRFDWYAMEVVNDIAEYPWRMAITPDTIDRVISPLQLMHDLAERDPDEATLVYRIADGGRLKTYQLQVEEREWVTTPAGRFEALRIRRRDPDSDRETLLWCAPQLHYLAVQIEQYENGSRNFRLRLAEVEGLPAPAGDADD